MTLGEYLEKNNVIGIANVDTRALTRKLREGCQVGCISTDASLTDEQLQEKARGWSILGLDLIKTVSTKDVYEWDEGTDGEWEFNAKLKEIVASGSKPFNVVAYDFGIKTNILRRLASFNCKVTVVPCDYPAEKAISIQYHPEASPGPHDADVCFEEFIDMMLKARKLHVHSHAKLPLPSKGDVEVRRIGPA
eukprot:jgi/Pico_ML_1/54210/g4616.t1